MVQCRGGAERHGEGPRQAKTHSNIFLPELGGGGDRGCPLTEDNAVPSRPLPLPPPTAGGRPRRTAATGRPDPTRCRRSGGYWARPAKKK